MVLAKRITEVNCFTNVLYKSKDKFVFRTYRILKAEKHCFTVTHIQIGVLSRKPFHLLVISWWWSEYTHSARLST